MLRTLTLHLPTNMPPPLHSEVIYTLFQGAKNRHRSTVHLPMLFYMAELVSAEYRWLTDSRRP